MPAETLVKDGFEYCRLPRAHRGPFKSIEKKRTLHNRC